MGKGEEGCPGPTRGVVINVLKTQWNWSVLHTRQLANHLSAVALAWHVVIAALLCKNYYKYFGLIWLPGHVVFCVSLAKSARFRMYSLVGYLLGSWAEYREWICWYISLSSSQGFLLFVPRCPHFCIEVLLKFVIWHRISCEPWLPYGMRFLYYLCAVLPACCSGKANIVIVLVAFVFVRVVVCPCTILTEELLIRDKVSK